MRDDSTSQVVLHKEMPFLEIRLTKESGRIYEEHSHPMLSIGVMLEGETQFFLQGEEFRLQTGMLAVIPPRMAHACNPLPLQTRSYFILHLSLDFCLEIQGRLFNEGGKNLLPLRAPRIFDPVMYEGLISLIQSLLKGYDSLKGEAFWGWCERFFARYTLEVSSRGDALISEVAEYLEGDVEEASLAFLSKRFQINPYTLERRFKKAYGTTPKRYHTDARLHRLKKLLRQGISLALCAQYGGFSDQSHFQRFFKRRVALTPREYQLNFVQ